MNERIKELIDQCSEYDEMSLGIWFNKEKFAELIVREFIQVTLQKFELESTFSSVIKQHFGVEE